LSGVAAKNFPVFFAAIFDCRTSVRSANASELLEKAILGTTKTILASKLPSGDISTQDSSSENSNTHENVLESTLLSSSKKRELEDQTDEEPPIKWKKEMDTEKRVLLMGETNSVTPSLTEAGSNDEIAGHGNKYFRKVICSSRPSAILNRNSDWEKLAMKSRSIFLKQRSQKMLKDRLEKYCVTRRKSQMSNSERLDAKRASQTPTAPSLTVPSAPPSAPPKLNQSIFNLLIYFQI
uniref:INCENP_ARK-bind domain-containing protein n=1 Tax=Onchocerca flexuosa TaxID=387005 RepID=A0A183HEG7_9BILA